MVAAGAAAEPDRPMFHTSDAGWLSRGDLAERSAAIAGRLHRAGLRAGDRLLCSAAPTAGLIATHLAALRMGLVVVPANSAYREAELAHVIGDARPAAVLVDRDDAAGWIHAADPDVLIVGPEIDLPEGVPPALDVVDPSAPALIGYTSGTTGRPKGAVLSHRNLLSSVQALRIAWRWTDADRLVLALPLFHMHGLGVGVHGTLVTGASAVVLPRFDAGDVIGAAIDHEATMFFGVPTMYRRLVDHPEGARLRTLRLCVSGSAPLDPELHTEVAQRLGQVVLERYGMTETMMLVSNPFDGERRAGTVGIPLPGVEVDLDADGGREGEIVVSGPNVFAGYWGRRDLDPVTFDEHGRFRTGDIGRFDDEGYLRIVGRSTELIISGGFNVYPREVEDALLADPLVADAAVVGIPSPEWGETVVAFVVPTAGAEPDGDAIIERVRDQLARFKCPREVRFVETLPRNALGKVERYRLRESDA